MVNQAGLTVRPLKASDVRTVSRILAPELRNLQSAQGAEATKVGIETFVGLLERRTDDLWSWLADMAGMDPTELDDAPLDTPITIIEQIARDDQLGPFLKRLQALVSQAPNASGTASARDTAGTTTASTA